jgi:hypothetical protein
MSSASHESFSSSQPHMDHDITFSVTLFMPPKSVIYRYFQILKDPQYYCPMLIKTADAPLTRAPVSPQTQTQPDFDNRIFS